MIKTIIIIIILLLLLLLLFYSFEFFNTSVFHRSLSDSKSPYVSRTLHSILVDISNAVVWMVSTRPLNSKSSSLCTSPQVIAPSQSITIGITVTFIFHSFFSSLAMSSYLSLFSLSFSFTLWSVGMSNSIIR